MSQSLTLADALSLEKGVGRGRLSSIVILQFFGNHKGTEVFTPLSVYLSTLLLNIGLNPQDTPSKTAKGDLK